MAIAVTHSSSFTLDEMLLTVSTTHQPATDLGYLLHKNPTRLQEESLPFGKAYVFYPEASTERCTMAFLVEIDPVGLVRGRGPAGEGAQLDQYVNDRPYSANSLLSVAMGRIFNTAMGGRSKDRPELAEKAIPLVARLPVIAARGGEVLVRRLFEPLGYAIQTESGLLDDVFPNWGESPYVDLTLTGTKRLRDLLTHLYVLIPVLDNEKHYWVSNDEVEKLLKRGDGWLADHPEKELIVSRYLKRQRSLTREALDRLLAAESCGENEIEIDVNAIAPERTRSIHEGRLQHVLAVLRDTGAKRVVDLGCGSGSLLRLLLAEPQFTSIVGMDVAWRSLEIAKERLRFDAMPERQRNRIELIQGSLTYRDERLNGFDAAAIVEVIEHLDVPRLATLERIVFEFARPRHVVLTTPNAEYNQSFAMLPAGALRHSDHRFEWTRKEFEDWANTVASRYGYGVRFEAVGPIDEDQGGLTQMAIFTMKEMEA